MDRRFAILRRRVDADDRPARIVASTTPRFGEAVTLPVVGGGLYACFDVAPTLLGSLSGLLLKRAPVFIRLTLVDGSVRRFRFVPGMARSEFLLSPLIENTEDFARQFEPEEMRSGKRVISVALESEPAPAAHWKSDYALELSTVETPRPSIR
jgi:hypothetical protein